MKYIKKLLIALLIPLCVGVFSQPVAAASVQLDSLPPELKQVLMIASEGQLKEAEKQLKSLRSSYGDTADYHYVKGSLAPFKLAEASVVRAPFIARGMRKDWENAVGIDPNHELANFSLALFYGAAPGIVGGDKNKAAAILVHLQMLDSAWQYPLKANLLMAQEATFAEIKAAYIEWIAYAPEDISPRFDLATYLINKEDYEAGAIQLTQLDALLQQLHKRAEQDSIEKIQSNQLKVDYQWGKLAAESGTHLTAGRERLRALITTGRSPENIGMGFVHVRLAQVLKHLGELELVAEHRSAAERLANGDSNLENLINKLDG